MNKQENAGMKIFKFNGNSDDTFGEYEQTNDDYDNCATGSPIQYELKSGDGAGIVVTGIYMGINKCDCWMIGVASISEDNPIDWEISVSPSYGNYKNQLTVIAPDDVALRCITRDDRKN